MQRVGLMNGNNITYDKDISADTEALMNTCVISGFTITGSGASASLLPGKALISCTRTNGEVFMAYYENTANVAVDLSGTKKVYIVINQAKIDDGSLNAEDGSGIGAITTGASYPAGNYVPLYDVVAGVSTSSMPALNLNSFEMAGLQKLAKGLDIASATTTDLSLATGNMVHITGTTPITSFGTVKAGTEMCTIFDDITTLTHNATSMILVGGTNITTAVNDVAYWRSEGGGNWRCVGYQKANGQAISASMDINGLAEKTTLVNGDFFSIYDSVAGVNKKVKNANITSFGGDGSDGAVLGTSSITITGSNNTIITKNYSSFAPGNGATQAFTNDPVAGSSIVLNMASTAIFTVGDWVRVSSSAGAENAKVTAIATNVSITVDTLALNHTTTTPVVKILRTFTITPTGCTLIIKVQGDCDLTNWYFDFASKGTANAVSGKTTLTTISGGVTVVNSGTGGINGTNFLTPGLDNNLSGGIFNIGPGTGGGDGGKGPNAVSGAGGVGGYGGGCVFLKVSGNLTLDSVLTTLNFKGANGAPGTGNGFGGGGGGSGGIFLGLYKGTLTGTCTPLVTQGSGGTGSQSTGTFQTGGGGSGGNNITANGANGGNGSAASSGFAGTGGAGALGVSLIGNITSYL